MDKRKDSLCTLKICRFCLTQDVPMTSLYDNKRRKNAINLPLKILSSMSVEVFPSDKMPLYICERCKYFMNLCYDFKQICRHADESILHFIQDNKTLKPVSWPLSLNDAYRKSNDIGVMKTVVEDGTTVQVSQDISDTEDEDDENVYNIKINDGSDDGSKTCIKVVASINNPEDEEPKKDNKGSRGRCWACDECDCTYPLEQMLELHKIRKHRQRNVKCDMCDDKFFSKYDLAIHQLRHSDDMPFQCGPCGKKFKRLVLLKRHEKSIHADLAQQVCQHCPASFLTHEELEAHSKKHENSIRPYRCHLCDKKFLEKATMVKHIHYIHNTVPKFACQYCPQRFSSVSKLARHIRSHAGERPYPCKYCDKSFMKSHHYTRHIRLKHHESERALASSNGDQYRCEQCDVSFGNQDELIYHSAIHATQNLTCPLCQEKFDNVDAVTTHIKSHVNGVEFMCDYCELVFTTKDKLDNHMMLAHMDEVQNEMGQDESSMEIGDVEIDAEAEAEDDDDDDDDDDNSINVKEEDDHMVIEIKKTGGFMLKNQQPEPEEKPEEISEESDSEPAFAQFATINKIPVQVASKKVAEKAPDISASKPKPQIRPTVSEEAIIQKPGEIKHRATQQVTENSEKKEKLTPGQATKIEAANDKSLRLLEKELQDLKRTNSRSEAVKTPPIKSLETPRPRGRPPILTSTPKLKRGIYRPVEEKKPLVNRTTIVEKKQMERKLITKENKEPKEVRETKPNFKDENLSQANKSAIKNGTSEKTGGDDGIRRSTRPSKIKDYAKMIRINSQEDSDSEELDDDEEYKQGERNVEVQRMKARRNSVRVQRGSPAAPAATPSPVVAASAGPPRKRGRPRKEPQKELPAKIKKIEPETETEEAEGKLDQEVNDSNVDAKQIDDSQDSITINPEPESEKVRSEAKIDVSDNNNAEESNQSPKGESELPPSDSKLVSPSGQSLKKVPIKSLPPGVKPLPLPLVGRSLPSGELCEMQIGKKVVKVQKIVMTKAEVEEMAKKGLVEMKGGTMVLKQGIKLPKVDSVAVKAVAGNEKESPSKRNKLALPTRCDIGED